MLLLCAKTIMKESHKFEIACQKKKKKKNLAIWRLSGSILSRCILAPLGVLFIMKTLEDEQWGVITAYKLAVLEILRNLLALAYIACPCYPYI